MTEKIMVLRLSALGDVAMTLPAVYSLAYTYPKLKVVFVTENRYVDLVVDPPANLKVMGVDRRALRRPGGMPLFMHRLRREKPDAIADLHNILRTWAVDAYMKFRGKRVVMVDKMRHERRKIKHDGMHTKRGFVGRYFDVFKTLGYPSDPSLFKGYVFSGVTKEDGVRRIGIAPFARYDNKMLPAATIERVLELLAKENSVRVSLFGGGVWELAQIKAWRDKFGDMVEYISGNLGLRDELAVMSGLDVMLTMDSANMHLASLVGTRVVSVWGSTTPACGFMGWGQNEADAIHAGLHCQPCTIAGTAECKHGTTACIHAITAEEIVARLLAK